MFGRRTLEAEPLPTRRRIQERKWRRIMPHYDVRICEADELCQALVHGDIGQIRHGIYHEVQADEADAVRALLIKLIDHLHLRDELGVHEIEAPLVGEASNWDDGDDND